MSPNDQGGGYVLKAVGRGCSVDREFAIGVDSTAMITVCQRTPSRCIYSEWAGTTIYQHDINSESQLQSNIDFLNQATDVVPVGLVRHTLGEVPDCQYHLLCATCRAHFSVTCAQPSHQYPLDHLATCISRSRGQMFSIPSTNFYK